MNQYIVWSLHSKAVELRDLFHMENDPYEMNKEQLSLVQECAELIWEPSKTVNAVSKFFILFILYKMGYLEEPEAEKCAEATIPILEKIGLITFNHDYGYWEVA